MVRYLSRIFSPRQQSKESALTLSRKDKHDHGVLGNADDHCRRGIHIQHNNKVSDQEKACRLQLYRYPQLTLETMTSWSARWVAQLLHDHIRVEPRYALNGFPMVFLTEDLSPRSETLVRGLLLRQRAQVRGCAQ